jgi:hypothetical protein
MRRAVIGAAAGTLAAPRPGSGDGPAVEPPAAPLPLTVVPLRTEFDFVLPRGYVDQDGVVHREGSMRLATARDELLPLYDGRVRERPEWLSVVLLARVLTRLGTIENVTDSIIERLFASDFAFLQDLYRRINQEGHTHATVTCPACSQSFDVDVAGGRLGGS